MPKLTSRTRIACLASLLLLGEQVLAQAPHPMRVSDRDAGTTSFHGVPAAPREFLGPEADYVFDHAFGPA